MTSPEDSNLGQRWSTPNPNIPTSGFLRLQAEEDVNGSIQEIAFMWFAEKEL